MSNFADPAEGGGDKLPYDDLNGSLLLVTVKSVEEGIQTTFGVKDAIKADIAVLDGDHKAERYEDTLIFPKVLVGALRSNVGRMVLGRLGQGNAKPGQKPPWILAAGTDADKATATKYLDYVAKTSDDAPF